TISNRTGLRTILNDDPAPSPGSISIDNVSITEADSGTRLLPFTGAQTGAIPTFNVNYATADGGATVADNDYVGKSGTLQFGANEIGRASCREREWISKVDADET